jgi:SAM-dependent MidA family methyltransferase
MFTGEPALIDFMRDRMRRSGPVPFRWFMEQALYHPEHGYYSSGRCALGRDGDYFTSVSVGPLFGSLMAAQFAEIWERLGRPGRFTIVEQGAHDGDFAHDVLSAAQSRSPDFFAALRYDIAEPFPILRKRQADRLESLGEKIAWHDSLEKLPPFHGVYFCNELLDAMPVHLVSAASEWQERYVREGSDGFEFCDGPLSTGSLREFLQTIPLPAPPYETEANLAAVAWMETLAPKLERGYALIVDYGYARPGFYAPERRTGTLQCVMKHRGISTPLQNVGHADITAHVEWTSLAERAEQCGLEIAGFADQHHFISGLITTLLTGEFSEKADAPGRRALQTLLHPSLLGMTFQFLGLSRALSDESPLSGFSPARDSRTALALAPKIR